MDDPDSIEQARLAVLAEAEAKSRAERALLDRNAAVRLAFERNPSLGPKAFGDATGLGPSLVRMLTRDISDARKRAGE